MRFVLALLIASSCAAVQAENISKPQPTKSTSLAQRKADIQAARRCLCHVGGASAAAEPRA